MYQWPPDYLAEFKRRQRLLNCLRDKQLRADTQLFYRTHPVEWINDWCVTYDPRNKSPLPRLMPFRLFPRQEEFVRFIYDCIVDAESGLVEKARDMGASWVCCAISVWLWLYWDGVAVGWGSRKEDLVDKKGDMSAIFPKMRMIIDNLPAWMQPKGYNPKFHAAHMKIINPENGSVITGEAGDNIGRGGRTTVYFKDEAAHYERPELIEASLGDNTDVQIDISSVNGTANVFYRRRMAGEVWYPDQKPERGKTRVFIMDWRDHPNKTQEWYDRRREKAEREALLHIFKQEVERDYSGAVLGVIIPQEWVKAAIDAHLVLKQKYPDIYPNGIPMTGEKTAGQDIADDGGDKNALVVRHGRVAVYAEHWAGEAGEAAKQAVPTCAMFGVKELYYDSIGVGVGFKVQINTMRETWANWPQGLRVMPWNAGAGVLDPQDPSIQGDEFSPNNEDQYENLRAQSWFRTRTAFYKTYRAVMYGEEFPPEELISIDGRIPRLHELCNELSQPVRKTMNSGKTGIEKKPDGATSPNLSDAFIQAFNPTREVSILDVL